MRTSIIIEMGRGTVRAGLSNRDEPSVSFPMDPQWATFSERTAYALFTQVFTKLKVKPANYPVIVTTPLPGVQLAQKDRTLIAQVLMGTFQVPLLYCDTDSLMGLYSAGYTGGYAIAIYSEDNSTSITPYYNSSAILTSVRLINHAFTDSHFDASGYVDMGQIIYNSFMSAEPNVSRELAQNLYAFGKHTTDYVILNLVTNWLANQVPESYQINRIKTPPDPLYAVWKGARLISLNESLYDVFFSAADFQTQGAHFINIKMPV